MRELDFHGPTTVEAAVALLAGVEARPLAGGTDLIAQVREGRRMVARAVDLKRIPELTTLDQAADGGWRIGAATTIAALGRDARFAATHPGLLEAARMIGSLQIQARASLGGNICNAAPSADAVPILVCLDAQAEIAGPGGRRRIPVTAFATGPGKTALGPGELLVAVHIPPRSERSAARYLRYTPRREMDIAVAGSAAFLELDAAGGIVDARIALASVGPTVIRAEMAARALIGKPATSDAFARAGREAAAEARPISDARGSAEYQIGRAHV